jgi:hypothetical protein
MPSVAGKENPNDSDNGFLEAWHFSPGAIAFNRKRKPRKKPGAIPHTAHPKKAPCKKNPAGPKDQRDFHFQPD